MTLSDSLPEPPPVEARLIDARTGYVRVSTFSPDAWYSAPDAETRERSLEVSKAAIDEAMARVARASTLVLDLRDNGGGTDRLGSHLAEHLLATPFTYFKLIERLSPELGEAGWSDTLTWGPASSKHEPFRGKLIVLQDEGCFSTTDNLLACLADLHPDVRFVGRPTNGGTGAPKPLATLPRSRAVVTACSMRVLSPDGRLIEGVGTKPHVLVRWTQQDLLEHRDPDLEAALSIARRRWM